MNRAGTITVFVGLCLGSGCTSEVAQRTAAPKPPIHRGVHTGDRSKVGNYYSVLPTCETDGYPEITVVNAPKHGKVSSDPGEVYTNFARDNVRWDCNRKPVPGTQLFYQSDPGFEGKDSFSIAIRWPSSDLRTDSYDVEVMPRAQ